VHLDGDEMTADADDGDAGHFSGTYICFRRLGKASVFMGDRAMGQRYRSPGPTRHPTLSSAYSRHRPLLFA
jgi:hypothetical protein